MGQPRDAEIASRQRIVRPVPCGSRVTGIGRRAGDQIAQKAIDIAMCFMIGRLNRVVNMVVEYRRFMRVRSMPIMVFKRMQIVLHGMGNPHLKNQQQK